jgi:hypothetical protein
MQKEFRQYCDIYTIARKEVVLTTTKLLTFFSGSLNREVISGKDLVIPIWRGVRISPL